ncbi:MAG: Ldh family oxidoreductase [Burkholderiaceae bacterium]
MSTVSLSLDEIQSLAHRCLRAAGADDANAEAVARILMMAERDGATAHGLFRVPGYVAALNSGKVNGRAQPEISRRTPVILHCHGGNGYAPLAHRMVIPALVQAARSQGLALAAITHSHHFAALWPEVEMLAGEGLFALSCVSYMPSVAPAGGSRALFGTNPIAWAWPRPGQPPIVLDMATAAMARGEVAVAARDGHPVPPGTGLDAQGQATTDPARILEGVLLPFGGYKGAGLAMLVELLAGPMVGETFSFQTAARDNKDGGPPQGGQFLMAIDPARVSGSDPGPATEAFIEKLRGIDGARLPGERRQARRLDAGPRPIDAALVEKLRAMAEPTAG